MWVRGVDHHPIPPTPLRLQVTLNRKELGLAFKKDGKAVTEYLESLTECEAMELKAKLEQGPAEVKVGGQAFSITPSMIDIKKELTRQTGRNFTPAVIEPSFGEEGNGSGEHRERFGG